MLAAGIEPRSRCPAQAYRQGAKRLHPDKAHAEGVSKEVAEKAFHDLAEAYEVLLCGERACSSAADRELPA